MLEFIRVNVILTANCQGDIYEASEIVYCDWKTVFSQHAVGQMFETVWRVEKLAVETVLAEDRNKRFWILTL